MAACGSTQLTHAGIVVSIGAADGRGADRVAEMVAARRADASRPATVGRRRAACTVVTSGPDARIATVDWEDIACS